MRKYLRALCGAILLCGIAASARADVAARFGTLTVDDVGRRIGDRSFHVYDCNPKAVFDRGHVPQARWVDYSHVSASDLPSDKSETLVFYCANEH